MDWINQHYIIRRLLLLFTGYMTWDSYQWAANFAMTTTKTGAEVGLIVAAVTAPVSLLLGQVAKIYSDGRGS